MNNIIMLHGKPHACFHFNFNDRDWYGIKSNEKIKPYNVQAYCNCKCVNISKDGWGLFELCPIHTSKAQQISAGDTIIPEVRVTFYFTMWEIFKAKFKRTFWDFTGVRI